MMQVSWLFLLKNGSKANRSKNLRVILGLILAITAT
jgi:hypothetical protein